MPPVLLVALVVLLTLAVAYWLTERIVTIVFGSGRHGEKGLTERPMSRGEFVVSSPIVLCIRDGRTPEEGEVASVSERLWIEGIAHLDGGRRVHADTCARVALTGCGSVEATPPEARIPHEALPG